MIFYLYGINRKIVNKYHFKKKKKNCKGNEKNELKVFF